MPVNRDDILRALDAVRLPDGQSLPASGRLTDIVANDGKVIFAITVDPSEVNALESVRASAERIVKALPGVTGALVGLTADKPQGSSKPAAAPGPTPMRSGPKNPAPATSKLAGIPGVKHIIAVASGKGGVGKSTTSCNLALGARRARPQGRHPRRRHLRALAAQALRPARQAARHARAQDGAAGALRREGHVHRLPRR